MPKAEKGSLKDLGKKIKSKGLQKLKFYCQMCEKQCRDANGFKCHLTSESHLRQMKVFSENAGMFMDRYSKEFEKMYLDTLRMRHGTSRTPANMVYQQVIQDKVHIHMNATIWLTLTDFCKYLGKTGKCVVEETERGWYVTYIEQNVARLQQHEATLRRLELEQAAEVASLERMEQQRLEAAKALDRAGGVLLTQATKLERDVDDDESAAIHISLNPTTMKTKGKRMAPSQSQLKSVFGNDDDDDDNDGEGDLDTNNSGSAADESRRSMGSSDRMSVTPAATLPSTTRTAASESLKSDDASLKRLHSQRDSRTTKTEPAEIDRAKKARRDLVHENDGEHHNAHQPWLYRGILVRIISKDVANGKYYRCKAMVEKTLNDGCMAEVMVADGNDQLDGDVLRLDQDDLETVAPKHVNEKVRIVRRGGVHYGVKARAIELDKKNCRAVLELKDGTILKDVDYDDFSKLA